MDPKPEITHDFPPFFKVYKDGRLERYTVFKDIPDGSDPEAGITTKDVVISAGTGLKARIFYPKLAGPTQRLPLLVHYHGGGFCIGSPFGEVNKRFLRSIVARGNVIAISVGYRLAPENPLPVAHHDSWAALKWVGGHASGLGPEKLLSDHVDFGRVFLMGESAGANLAHYVTAQVGAHGLEGVKIHGLLLLHPFFGNEEEDKMIEFLSGPGLGRDDPKLYPTLDPDWPKIGCERVLVCVAEMDGLRCRGEAYYKALKGSGWAGKLEFYESKGESHVFFMFQLNEERDVLIGKIVDFLLQA